MPAVGRKQHEPYIDSWKMEPLALATLAGLTPPDIAIDFFDDRIEAIDYGRESDLVAINVETYTARRAYEISKRFRQRGRHVVLGGFHPTLFPDEAIEFADAVVIGEAEDIWAHVIEDAKKRGLKKYYRSPGRPVLKGVNPRREIFANKRYLPVSLVESGRGCAFSCDFCSVSRFFNQSYVARPIQDIVREIESLGKKLIFLVDDNFGVDMKRAKELCQALIPLKITWFSQGSINMSEDEELLAVMKKSGCLGLLIGLESLNKDNLSQMNKSWNRGPAYYTEALQRFRHHGLVIYATFVFGYDHDDARSFDLTLDFAVKNKFFLAAFNHVVPFPGTPLYGHLKKEGRLLYDHWWLEPAYRFGDVAFKPLQISPEELSRGCMDARRKFYQFSSLLRRSVDFKANCSDLYRALYFFSINLLSQKEVVKRQGLPLGNEGVC
jgi:radical SAM superfamily enzyme YgiQ (UPF0313 family)